MEQAMKSSGSTKVAARAAQELRTLLEQISSIKVERIDMDMRAAGGAVDLLARVRVLGHPHTLACAVEAGGHPAQIRRTLEAMRFPEVRAAEETVPILIAPHLTSSMQAVCKERKVGFLDFEGNARLELDEVFIVKHTRPLRPANRRAAMDA